MAIRIKTENGADFTKNAYSINVSAFEYDFVSASLPLGQVKAFALCSYPTMWIKRAIHIAIRDNSSTIEYLPQPLSQYTFCSCLFHPTRKFI